MLIHLNNEGREEILNLATGQIYTYSPTGKEVAIFASDGRRVTGYRGQIAVALWGELSQQAKPVTTYPDAYIATSAVATEERNP